MATADGQGETPASCGFERPLRRYAEVALALRSGAFAEDAEDVRLPNLPGRWREPREPACASSDAAAAAVA